MEPQRVQKWLARYGIASRRTADQWIQQGRLKINNKQIQPGEMIHEPIRSLTLDGQALPCPQNHGQLSFPDHLYALMYKPSGVVVSTASQGGSKTIYDLDLVKKFCQQRPSGFVPYVGRLDELSEGLLILSTDGPLTQRLTHPSHGVKKVYVVGLKAPLTQDQKQSLRQGVHLDGSRSGPQDVKPFDQVDQWLGVQLDQQNRHPRAIHQLSWYQITLSDGKNRFIRKLFQAIGAHLIRLIRIQKGNLILPIHLAPGELIEVQKDDFHLQP